MGATRWLKTSDSRHPSCLDGFGQVICRLQIQPKLWRGPQGFGQIEGRIGGDASLASYHFIQARSAPADLLCERRMAHVIDVSGHVNQGLLSLAVGHMAVALE